MNPRVLVLDTETAPITAYVWSLFDQNVGLNQIKEDWHFLSWAAKWLGDPASKVMYMDTSKAKHVSHDKALVAGLIDLVEQADIVISQNGDRFDMRKLRARAAINRLPPFRPCRSTDLLKETRKVFGFTSHKLEYMTDKINHKYKKLRHEKYPGFDLWSAVLAGDAAAWKDMQTYNKHDVFATEELYTELLGWIDIKNVSVYADDTTLRCPCGSAKVQSRGFTFTTVGKYQRYQCVGCGKWLKSATNLLTTEKKRNLLRSYK